MEATDRAIACVASFLCLPAEIRMSILEHVFEDRTRAGFMNQGEPGGIYLDDTCTASKLLRILLTCRQFYQDSNILAFKRTNFIACSQVFFHTTQRLSILHFKQISSLRSVTFVADARHFRKLIEWGECPFGVSSLNLDILTIVLHRSSFWHYLFDYTSDIVKLLRILRGVKELAFVRNGALVKGSFRTWFNRLVGLIMKVDHHERYDRSPPECEGTWWDWEFDELAQRITLKAKAAKPVMNEEEYMIMIAPLMEELRISMENEEWNPDPRSRLMYY